MKKLILLAAGFLFFSALPGQNTFIYPTDTLVDPAYFESNNLLENWAYDFCPVQVNGPDTVFAPCYTVTFKDHYNTSITLCPPDTTQVGGMGLFYGDPRLLDGSLFYDMEIDGSNIVSNQDNVSVNYKNLTTGQTVDGGGPAPKYCIDADLYLGTSQVWYQKFQILLGPIPMPGPAINYHTAETIGILKNGMVLEHTPPSSESTPALNGGIIPIDHCGWHPEPAGFGHFHTIPYGINVSLAANGIAAQYQCADIPQLNNSGLAGFTFEGIPIYAPYDNGQSSAPTDLDSCGGHTSATPEFPNGVYHYHASATDIINNPPCRDFYAPLEDTRFEYGEWTGIVGRDEYDIVEDVDLLKISPNPAGARIRVEGIFDRFEMFDQKGSVVLFRGPSHNSASHDMDLEGIAPGLYFISAQLGNRVFFDKLVIK